MASDLCKDSKGEWWWVFKQQYYTSCGPASVTMVEYLYKKPSLMIDAEKKARELSSRYPGGWSSSGGVKTLQNLSNVLNAEGVRAYKATYGGTALYDYLWFYAKKSTPVVAGIKWTNSTSMGHIALCPRIYADGTAIFLDPWYGVVEIPKAAFPWYPVVSGPVGYLDGWIVVTY